MLGVGSPVLALDASALRVSTLLGEASRQAAPLFESDELDPPVLTLTGTLGPEAAGLPERGGEPLDLPVGKSAGTRISVAENLTYDSNVFRLRDSAAAVAAGLAHLGSWQSQTKLGLGLDKSYAGQQLLLDYDATMARYSHFGFLDHTVQGGIGRLRWKAGQDLKGELVSEYREALDDYAYYRSPLRSISTTRQMGGNAFYTLVGGWQVGAQAGRGSRRYKDGTRPTNEIDFAGVDGVLRYVPERGGAVALTRRRARGEYPNLPATAGSLAETRFNQDETFLEVSLPVRSGSRYLMRVGRVSRNYERYPQSNFSGRNGLIGAEWQVTPRTQLNGSLRYDVEPAQDFVSSYVATKGARLGAVWEYSPKTRIESRYEWRNAQYRGDPGFGVVAASRREDTATLVGVTALHAMSARTRWTASLSRERRDSNQQEWSFTDWIVAGSLQWVF
ncbi:MAG TPA: hypothetical protein PLX21_10060 [Rhodocyclaceae bacterium]|nr:hypothetical protein [Rhodocyclaceae bacterium]HNI82259.1 hypothetical protein [Rhodocyclaceae bacterium]